MAAMLTMARYRRLTMRFVSGESLQPDRVRLEARYAAFVAAEF